MSHYPDEQLKKLAKTLKNQPFKPPANPQSAKQLSLTAEDIYFNFSRNPINTEVLTALLALAKAKQLPQKIADFFAGKPINTSENRAVKHWLLRAPRDDQDADSRAVHQVRQKMHALVTRIRDNTFLETPITDVVCLGIGGSELGPRLVYEALTTGREKAIKLHFVANIDGVAAVDALLNCHAENTLFVVISKTFTTAETCQNFALVKDWFCQQDGLCEADFYARCCAVTADVAAAREYPIPEAQILAFWDWVGGRYSVCSAVGLPIAIACGMTAFDDFLAGAHAMDKHFQNRPLSENLPVILGLLHVWYSTYLGYPTRAVIPYAENLKTLPDFLQQLEMESLGKSVDIDGKPLHAPTCPIVWGGVGTSAQHAFFQLLHQGSHIVPIDFIAAINPCDDLAPTCRGTVQAHHTALLANCLAQGQSLMHGGSIGDGGHGDFAGNRPSNLILLTQINAGTLGQLMALYEHKVLVQSAIWGINAYDQFGVELGKRQCQQLLSKRTTPLTLADIQQSFET